ncbi:MAG: pitrilysin family protein [Acutalibacteraceae bacterium]|nr:pitrilysin family protein [Acutalibacteraceae bacterium]
MNKQIFKSDLLGEEYTIATLQNGLKIYVMEKQNFDSVYAVFGTKYGSIDNCFSLNDGEYISVPNGIAHFLEHKLFESEDGDAFTKYSKTGAYANAFTSFDKTCYLFSCSSMFDENLDILLDFVQSPYFTAETVKKEQGIIGQEIRMYDDSPAWCVLFNALECMYHNHPVKVDIAGTVESIAQIDDKLLYECYNTFYNPANMFICIAGNVNSDSVIEKISNSIKPCEKITINRKKVDEPKTIVKDYIEKSLPVAVPLFCLGYKQIIDKEEPSLRESIAVNLLLKLIIGESSPCYKKLTDMGLINDEFDTEYFTGRGFAAILFEGESNEPKRVAEEIKAEIKRLSNEGIDSQLFEAVKRDSFGDTIKRYDNVNNITMMFVDAAVSNYNIFDEIEVLKDITLDEVLSYLSVFDDSRTVLSVIKPKEN